MSKDTDKSQDQAEQIRPQFSPDEIAQAEQCFKRAHELAETKNYEYAIEWYINGLRLWPEAVEKGHKPCRAAALFKGGKKASFGDTRKYKLGAKDPKEAMLNAEMLMSKAPYNENYMEAMFKAAARGKFYDTMMWVGQIYFDTVDHDEKPDADHYKTMRKIYEEVGDQLSDIEPPTAILALEQAVAALTRLSAMNPQNLDISTDLRDVSGKLTILKGKYGSAETFRDSVRDAEAQTEMHDKDRAYQSDERMQELIDAAQARWQEEPESRNALNQLISLMTRQEREDMENKAVEILSEHYEKHKDYRDKARADDIRMKQMTRHLRKAMDSSDQDKVKEVYRTKLKFELKAYHERCKMYPSDMRLRFEYGRRLFEAKQYDAAIPVLQEARIDPKTRTYCGLYIGQCFFKKGYFEQAADTFREAISQHEIADDKLGKELHYWLGRALDSAGQTAEALKIFGQIIQWDYNYRKGEVRKRIDALRGRS